MRALRTASGSDVSGGLKAVVVSLLAACAVGCRAMPTETEPREYLDERTTATITVVEQPLVFARDRSERAVNRRDYVTLAATSINLAGKIRYAWVAYVWSTLDVQEQATRSAEALVITADDRRLPLKPLAATPAAAGISLPLHAPPHTASISRVYETDLQTMRFVAAARSLRVQTDADESAPYYDLWTDHRSSLSQFVRFLADGR